MLIPFAVTLIFIAFLMLVFIARTWWGNKEDIFYLSRKQKTEVFTELFPEKILNDTDPTINRMLTLLKEQGEEKNNYSK